MSDEQFMRAIVQAYMSARVSSIADARIRRGRSRAVSGIAEDLLAWYLVSNDAGIEKVYVDQGMSVPGVVRSFMPDIVIVRGGIITAFMDLKMDLGYKREGLIDLCQKDAELVSTLRGMSAILKDGATKELVQLPIAQSCIYDIIVTTDQNIPRSVLERQMSRVANNAQLVSVHILTSGLHPNQYGKTEDQIIERMTLHEEAFQAMLYRTRIPSVV